MRVISPEAAADAGWVTLFDGKNLDNWSPIGTANWKLEDGVVVAHNGNGFLVSKNAYTDFQLRVEFWIEAKTNNGVFIRCTDPASVTGKTAYEVNIWDHASRAEIRHRRDRRRRRGRSDADGRRQVERLRDRGQGRHVYRHPQRAKDRRRRSRPTNSPQGSIALQHGKGVSDESGIVKFRKVEIKPL